MPEVKFQKRVYILIALCSLLVFGSLLGELPQASASNATCSTLISAMPLKVSHEHGLASGAAHIKPTKCFAAEMANANKFWLTASANGKTLVGRHLLVTDFLKGDKVLLTYENFNSKCAVQEGSTKFVIGVHTSNGLVSRIVYTGQPACALKQFGIGPIHF
ncbi:MAG: hypothetical protein ACKOWK_05360 [Micrococcales bacterium]